ncbi:MAG: response regulator transcription factor [Bacteroidales bacterium]|nr:response regulator transcription factor [Bacteroidales bacterium]
MIDNKTSLLIVEDDTSMGFLLVDFFQSNGFSVVLCKDGLSGWERFQSDNIDFCLLDIMLPGMDGYTLAEKIRTINQSVPIIFLTARTMKIDKIKGFNLGIDDYVTKPFDEDELLCRINAVLNRVTKKQLTKNEDIIYNINLYRFDHLNQLLICDQETRRLTKKESDVLKMLCDKKNQIVTRDQLLTEIWGDNNYFNGRSLDVFITKLRKYLSHDTHISIENIPKVGFVLNCEKEQKPDAYTSGF